MGPKYTGKLWVYIGTPLPNPLRNTGVMVLYDKRIHRKIRDSEHTKLRSHFVTLK